MQHAPLDDPILSRIRKRRSDDHTSKLLAFIPQLGAKPQFDGFVREAFVGGQSTIRYLWRLFGYASRYGSEHRALVFPEPQS